MQKIIRLNITPETHVRSTQGDRIYFRIPRNKLRPEGLKRVLRLEKYNDYKESVYALALQQHFKLPDQGANITFFIPVPNSWPPWKKELMHMTLHRARPDCDNLIKGFFDSLFREDKTIGQFSASKQWVNNETGWIEIRIEQPKIKEEILHKSRKSYDLAHS